MGNLPAVFRNKRSAQNTANSPAQVATQPTHLNLITPTPKQQYKPPLPKPPQLHGLNRNVSVSTPNLFQSITTSRPYVKLGAGGVQVSVVSGQVTDEQVECCTCLTFKHLKVDVIVNGVPRDLDLSKARGSKKLLQVAGSSIQTECQNNYPRGIRVGQVAETGGGNLNCSKVYHVTLPKSEKDGSKNQEVVKIVQKCMELAENAGYTFIAFPDIGTSVHFPPSILADLMFKGVTEFSNSNSQTSVTTVVFSIYKTNVYKEFEKKARSQAAVSKVSHCQVGNINVTMKVGLLLDQQVDVIVCSGPTTLQLQNGGMAQAISAAAGPKMQQELDQKYPNGINAGDLAVSQGYNLKCKFVYHINLPDWNSTTTPSPKQLLESSVHKCLELANKHPTTTRRIAFPTLGTGALNYPPSDVAQTMAKCIKDFDAKYPSTQLNHITIVAYNQSSNWKELEIEFMKELLALGNQVKNRINNLHAKVPKVPSVPTAPVTNTTNPTSKKDYADLYKQDLVAPSSWTKYHNRQSLKAWNTSASQHHLVLLQPTDAEYTEIEKLVQVTWQQNLVGHGRDAQGLGNLGYSAIKVVRIERLENPDLFEKYAQQRAFLFQKASKSGPFKSLDQVPQNQKGVILTTQHSKSALKKDIYPGINEHYLFHGTYEDRIQVILKQGLDPRLAANPVFGKGVYSAESSTKSDQYADPPTQRCKVKEKVMLLTRVCLGEIYVRTDTASVHPYTRPPCKTCHKDRCTDNSHLPSGLFDSIVVDGGWNFREFIVYDGKACYPEYLVYYKRV